MKAAVLSIGTELTRGELVNTNACFLAERITELGVPVLEHCTVDDDIDRIVAAIQRLGKTSTVVVCTGGLGPTTDDLTAEAVARAAGVSLQRDASSLEAIRERFRTFGREMTPSNAKQADFPRGARVLANAVGTAPGFSVELGGATFYFMPGVPSEMRTMFERHVAPALAAAAPRTQFQLHLRTFGLGESLVGEKLVGIEAAHPGVTLGYRAHFPEVEVKVLAESGTLEGAERLAGDAAAVVKERLGSIVFGGKEDTFAGVLGRELRTRNLTLAVAESCTGGLVGSMLTAVPGSSDYVTLDAVTYSNRAKTAVLGVEPSLLDSVGAVSSEVAAAMAEGALRVSGADLAVSITGIAGPGGGSEEKPVGTVWFGLARRGFAPNTQTKRFPGDRARVRTMAAYTALAWVREVLAHPSSTEDHR